MPIKKAGDRILFDPRQWSNEHHYVIIIGGGPAGLAAALKLKMSNGIETAVYEIRPEPTTLGGAVNIRSNGLRLLDRMGILSQLELRASSVSQLKVHSMGGAILADLDMAGWSREQTGFVFMRALRTDLIDVLLEEANKQNIPVHFSKSTTKIVETETEINVTFSDGTQVSADLLLGCDGIHSAVRRLHVNPSLTPEYTGFSNMFTTLPTSSLSEKHRSLEPALHGLLTNESLLGVMPCTASGDHLYWFYSREVPVPAGDDNRSGWEAHGKMEVDGFKDSLKRVLQSSQGPWADQLREIVQKTETIKFYPIYRLPLSSSWSTKRCLVIGDTAHAMPPHAGQGTSMALEDVFLLSRLLEDSERPLREVLSKYSDIRRPRVEAIGRASVENGNVRKDVGPWALKMKECALGLGFWFYRTAGLQKWGIGMNQKDFAYDIMEEPI